MTMNNIWKDITNLAKTVYNQLPQLPATKEVETIIIKEIEMSRPYFFVRIAGLSGAIAVAMSAYGAHAFRTSDADEALKETFNVGNKQHLIHSVALLGSCLARRPMLVGTMMTAGMIMFSGSCYYHALTGDTRIRWITPYGGTMLIFAWVAMIF
ncbi:transmembrane protein 256 homolog [Gigantopelta aegis]|uniref:transmembrane protein 256 homolog n=1 Tax=Gigantopelta aegis TaxID=1735272 RepID=UPI001B88936A|nr:transmembrane protein 256 homolog [Gigantopelta aegis]